MTNTEIYSSKIIRQRRQKKCPWASRQKRTDDLQQNLFSGRNNIEKCYQHARDQGTLFCELFLKNLSKNEFKITKMTGETLSCDWL